MNADRREQVFWPAGGVYAALLWQAGAGLAGISATALWSGFAPAVGVAYGILLSMINSAWLARGVRHAVRLDLASGQRVLYMGAVLRFLVILAALLLAYGLGLHLLAVAGGMFLAQMALFVYAASCTGGDLKNNRRELGKGA